MHHVNIYAHKPQSDLPPVASDLDLECVFFVGDITGLKGGFGLVASFFDLDGRSSSERIILRNLVPLDCFREGRLQSVVYASSSHATSSEKSMLLLHLNGNNRKKGCYKCFLYGAENSKRMRESILAVITVNIQIRDSNLILTK